MFTTTRTYDSYQYIFHLSQSLIIVHWPHDIKSKERKARKAKDFTALCRNFTYILVLYLIDTNACVFLRKRFCFEKLMTKCFYFSSYIYVEASFVNYPTRARSLNPEFFGNRKDLSGTVTLVQPVQIIKKISFYRKSLCQIRT